MLQAKKSDMDRMTVEDLRGKSLYFLGPTHPFRLFFANIVLHPMFDLVSKRASTLLFAFFLLFWS